MQDDDLLIFLQEEPQMEKNLEFFDENTTERIGYFHKWVYKLHDGGFTYMEAIINFCEEHDVEYEYITKVVSPQLKQDLYDECIEFNLMKKRSNESSKLF